MPSHRDRMGEIAFWAIPSKDSSARAEFDKRLEKDRNNPEIKKRVKKVLERASALVTVQQENGLGFPADQMLREYNLEYNSRVFKGSLNDLPGSFNVVEAFNKFLPLSATFEIRKERDHLFSFDDFVDYVTSDFNEEAEVAIKDVTENGTIYSYNSTSDPRSLEFSTTNGEKYTLSSISLVRFDDEVSMVLLAGQICDLEGKNKEIRQQISLVEPLRHRAHITLDPSREARAEPLIEGSNLWKTVVLARFDLQRKTIDARYVYHDWGQSYQGLTDDIGSYLNRDGKFYSPELEKNYEKSCKRVNEYQALFELCKTCLLIPRYFHDHEEDVTIERHPTRFLEFRKQLKNRKVIELVGASHWVAYREAYVLSKRKRRSPEVSAFFAPEYKVESSGYWKKLPVQAEGRDKNGNVIHGRTWVSQTLSWVEDNSADSRVVVEKKERAQDTASSGYIYVMRSAAHEKDIFKVGLTRRTTEERANELSRSTSSPDHFLVVEEWFVNNCVLAERLIHAKLDRYRINPNREYFKARYTAISAVINEVITELEKA